MIKISGNNFPDVPSIHATGYSVYVCVCLYVQRFFQVSEAPLQFSAKQVSCSIWKPEDV